MLPFLRAEAPSSALGSTGAEHVTNVIKQRNPNSIKISLHTNRYIFHIHLTLP